MAEPDIQFPDNGDDDVIPDGQPRQDQAVEQPPPPVDAPAAAPSVASTENQNDEMEVYSWFSMLYVFSLG